MKKIYFVIIALLLLLLYTTWEPHGVAPGTVAQEASGAEGAPEIMGDSSAVVTRGESGEPDAERVAYEIPVYEAGKSEMLLQHYGYTVSYNSDLCIPNWVAWELNAEKLVERESRNKHFLPDPELPEEMAVTTDEYKNSGWDRGHMCPAGDNKYHWRAMDACFYMTNICPQNGNLNRGDWKELEEDCRRWAAREPVYIVCGPVLYRKPKYGFIGKRFSIRVPDAFFKVVLTGLQSGRPRAIGFLYKNEAGNRSRDKYVNTVDQLERLTSMDFFPALPDDVEERIEASYDLDDWR